MTYIFYLIIKILTSLLCYLTNPIVVLFADEYGNLPKIFKLWQTHDNCLDVSWMIYEDQVLDCFKYDFNKHYIYHYEDKDNGNFIPGYVEIIDPNFTIKEKIQRYFCRLSWLYRNNAYGFSYYILGRKLDLNNQNIIKNIRKTNPLYELYFSYINKGYFILNYPWCLYCDINWISNLRFRLYLGWKFKFSENDNEIRKCQLAFSINPIKPIE